MKIVKEKEREAEVRVVKAKDGSLFLETNKRPEVVKDMVNGGREYFYIHLPPINEILRYVSSPLLEDIYAEIGQELQERDAKWVQENF